MLHNYTEDLSLKNAIDNALKGKNCQDFIKMLNDQYCGKSLDLIMINEFDTLLGYIICECIEKSQDDKEGKIRATALTMMDHVINMGANVNACANYHQKRKIEAYTPLTLTLLSPFNEPSEITPILTLLLQRGANPDLCARDARKFPILCVSYSEHLRVLVEHKANPNLIYQEDSNSLSPLAFFILRMNHARPDGFKYPDEDSETIKCLQLLIKHGADPLFCSYYQSSRVNLQEIAKIYHKQNKNHSHKEVIELLDNAINPVKVVSNFHAENVATLFSAPLIEKLCVTKEQIISSNPTPQLDDEGRNVYIGRISIGYRIHFTGKLVELGDNCYRLSSIVSDSGVSQEAVSSLNDAASNFEVIEVEIDGIKYTGKEFLIQGKNVMVDNVPLHYIVPPKIDDLLQSETNNPVKAVSNFHAENVATLFSASPSRIKEEVEVNNDSDDDSDDELRDPITLELMQDPITIDCGHAFDRKSLSNYYHSEKPNCHSCPSCQTPIAKPPEAYKTSIALKKSIAKKIDADVKMRK